MLKSKPLRLAAVLLLIWTVGEARYRARQNAMTSTGPRFHKRHASTALSPKPAATAEPALTGAYEPEPIWEERFVYAKEGSKTYHGMGCPSAKGATQLYIREARAQGMKSCSECGG